MSDDVRSVAPASAGVFALRRGKVLAVRSRSSGKWGLPFGKVEPGETALDAAKRETAEETGVRVVHATPFFSAHSPTGEKAVTFLALEFEGDPCSSSEGVAAWVSTDVITSIETGRFPEYNRALVAHATAVILGVDATRAA